MKRTALAIAFAASATAASAQLPTPERAPEMEKFAPMIGSWEGRGTAVMAPGTQPGGWTSISTVSWILGGQFVQEDTRVDTPVGSMVFRAVYAWDREREQLVTHTFGNTNCGEASVHWLDDKTLYTVVQGVENGAPMVERWTTTFDGDTYSTVGERGVGDGPFHTYVEGEFKRTERTFEAHTAEASFPFAQPAAELNKLKPLLGDYTLSGSYVMTPGAPAMKITGEESSSMILGGNVLYSEVEGQPGDYRAQAYTYWDEQEKCYVHVALTSMGEVGSMQARWVDGSLVYTGSSVVMGVPGADRVVTEIEDGAITRVTSHRMPGTQEPYQSFEATYRRAGQPTGDESGGESGSGPQQAGAFAPGSCCARAAAAGEACASACCVAAAKAGEVCAACNG